jgi:uncharacterized protein YjlB
MKVVAHLLPPAREAPNHPRWPLLLYPNAVQLAAPENFEALFTRNGWPAAWRNGVFGFHHFHSNAHEALGVYSGEVTVQVGGEPGVVVTARPGDVIVLPAGTGHKRLASRGVLGVVGAYPRGSDPDTCQRITGSETILQVPLPPGDPVFGERGPLFEHWR